MLMSVYIDGLYKEAMKRDGVVSSNIKSIGYDPLRKKLEVEFNSGSVYRYKDVPKSVYNEFMSADSKGRYLNQNIKYNYKYRKYKDNNGDTVIGKWRELNKAACDVRVFMDKIAMEKEALFGIGEFNTAKYQTPDGGLNNAGKQYINSHSADALYKGLKKDVRRRKKEFSGAGSEWSSSASTGPNYDEVFNKHKSEREAITQSDLYKERQKRLGSLDPNDQRYYELRTSIFDDPKYDDINNWEKANTGWFVSQGGINRPANKEYLRGYGKNQTIAYLKDLGYNDETAKYLQKQLAKGNIVL